MGKKSFYMVFTSMVQMKSSNTNGGRKYRFAPPYLFPQNFSWILDVFLTNPYRLHRRRAYRAHQVPESTAISNNRVLQCRLEESIPEDSEETCNQAVHAARGRTDLGECAAVWGMCAAFKRRGVLILALSLLSIGWFSLQGLMTSAMAYAEPNGADECYNVGQMIKYFLVNFFGLNSLYPETGRLSEGTVKLMGGGDEKTWWCPIVPSWGCHKESYGLGGPVEYLWREYGVSEADYRKSMLLLDYDPYA